jgi:photosystem II stability/assembly factor-like uncharacterized protein
MRTQRATIAILLSAGLCAPLFAQTPTLDSTVLAAFRWRNIGPATMSGRVTDIEGIASPSRTFFVAAATGGIWKTTNAGTTFRPVFDDERVISMGDLAIAPSDTNIIWAGTGEEDSRNSISPGGGIYQSTDGGMTWKLMGLTETQQIGRIVVHPTNPNIVYVAAVGHAWGPNPERGLYQTTDGGQTWKLIKFISDKAGFVDIAMDPGNPNVLFASSWERVRGPYFLKSGGPGSALWKTADGGATWTEVKGGGFPETMKGRIGIAIAPSNPQVVYALVEADTAKGMKQRPSGLYRSNDGGATWEKMNSNDTRPFYYSQVRVDPKNPDRVYWSSTPINYSDDGGKTVRNAAGGVHVDDHALWIDPNDPAHFVLGNDGGIAQTWDKGGNYDVLNVFAIGQFYDVSFDFGVPYRVCGGLQDNGSWCGPSRRARGAITNPMWFVVGGGDGFYTAQDPTDPNIVYAESQGGNIGRLNVATGERTSLVKPSYRPRYQLFEDSIIINRPDTAAPMTRDQQRRQADLRARQAADSAASDLRFNWETPFFISPHSPSTLYIGANKVLKTTDRGDHLYPISPDLTTRDTMRIRVSTKTTGGITPDVTGAETHSTVVALAESPVRPGLLYAGTDDGNLWLSRNDGGSWENLTGRAPGVPPKTWVSRIEPSHFDSATFYVSFDNHRENDFTPYLYVTTDFGKTFTSIANRLPQGGPDFVHVVREDPNNRDLLFAGTDVGAFVSRDRGASWQQFMTGLPTVPVYDLKIHPRDRELIAGTHGRSVWIVDIAPLEQMTDPVLAEGAHLFEPKTAYAYGDAPAPGDVQGQKAFQGASAPYGAEIVYRLTSGEPRSRVQVVITNVKGDTLQTVQGPGGPGVHRVYWDFRGRQPAAVALGPAAKRDSIRFMQRVDVVFDSLSKAGMPAPFLNRLRDGIKSGDVRGLFGGFGGAGGGGAAAAGRFAERPAESAGGRGVGGGAAGAESGGEGAPPDPGMLQQIIPLLRPAGAGGGGGGFGFLQNLPFLTRPQAAVAETGDYLISITVNGKTMSQVLRVERMAGAGGGLGFFEEP